MGCLLFYYPTVSLFKTVSNYGEKCIESMETAGTGSDGDDDNVTPLA